MAAYTSYDVVGKKEDISDIITNISPTKTPFQSLVGDEKVWNTLYQWQEDSLAAVNLSNAQVEGFDATETAPAATTMRSSYTQIFAKTVKVSSTNDTVSRYGRAKETAYQIAKFSAEVKRDLEGVLLSGQSAAVGSTSVARTTGSYQAQVSNAFVHTGGASTAMTEAQLLGALQTLYTNGVDPSILMIPPAESIAIAGYASAAGRYRTIPTEHASAKSTLVNVVDLYVSPFGEVKVILNRFQLATYYLIFEPDMWKLATLRSWTRETLAKIGDSTRMMIVGEFGLKHKNYLASHYVRKVA